MTKKIIRISVLSFIKCNPEKFYFILTSCFVLATLRINVVLFLKNGKIRKVFCYHIFCKKIMSSSKIYADIRIYKNFRQ